MPEPSRFRPAVFLDRDGTICDEVGYLNHVSRFRMFPFAAAALRRLNDANFSVIVVSNQSGVARGYFPESLVQQVNQVMVQQLSEAGAKVDGVYYCPHASSDNCECRKPKPGMVERAALEHCIDLQRSFVVGDRHGDVQLAHNAKARGILVRTGYGEGELAWHASKWPAPPDFIAEDLTHAVDWLLRQAR
ncbi:MAG TPA: HAD family hydrolase [Candidatus Acidoferrum sp.]|nr:HAD family hydrolase [Candidatus Acidoferrum sp.]